MIDFIRLSDTTHEYTGGSNGPLSIDGDFNTAYSGSVGGGTGSANFSIESKHTFSGPKTIKQVIWRSTAAGNSTGVTDNGSSARYRIDYALASDPTTWITFDGASAVQELNAGGGGGTTNSSVNSGDPAIIDVFIPNVIAVRAVTSGSYYANENGSGGASGTVYEVQAWGDIGGFAIVI